MGVLDGFVIGRLAPLLATHWVADAEPQARVSAALVRVRIGSDRIEVVLKPESLAGSALQVRPVADGVETAFDIRLKHRQGALILEPAGGLRRPPRAWIARSCAP